MRRRRRARLGRLGDRIRRFRRRRHLPLATSATGPVRVRADADALLRDKHAVGDIADAALLVPRLYRAREGNALDATREELRDLRTSTFLYESSACLFTPRTAATTTTTTTIGTASGSSTGGGGESRIFIAGVGVTFAA